MDILCALPIQYINNRIGAREYATKHLDIAAELYRKIEFNHADDDYKTNYSTEIEMIKKLSKACDDYNLGHVSTDEFNTHIEDALSEYVMTDFKKSKYFID